MTAAEHAGPWWTFRPLRDALIAGVMTGCVFVVEHLGLIPHTWAIAPYVVAILLGGRHWTREGLEDLWNEHAVGIEILMLAATVGAAALGLWDEAATLVVLYGAAEGLEELALARTRSSVRALLALAPKEAQLLTDGREQTVRAEQLRPGDVFVVRPGQGIVTDGVIVSGSSSLNEAAVTGESVPVEKAPGASVFAGSLNGEGALTIAATTVFADNTLSRIIHLVEEAQEQKGRAQQWIERFGRRYSPAVLIAAVLLLLLPLFTDQPFGFWAQRAVVLLVAAAPCALVMSMPMAMAAAIGAAGRRGILIKGGVHLEHLGRIRAVAFDKTGTLTVGRPEVTDVIGLTLDRTELLQKTASIEHYSQHPLAQAIVRAAKLHGVAIEPMTEFQSTTGGGATAILRGAEWIVGSPTFLKERHVSLEAIQQSIDALRGTGATVVAVAAGGVPVGLLAIRDEVRPGAREVIDALHTQGLDTIMLTGDNGVTARAVAEQVGMAGVRADLKPEDKVRALHELALRGPVLMVGDGINDAPALAAATCGIAMGAAGSDAAIEAADVALMTDDLGKVLVALEIGRLARRISVQNIVLSVLVLAVMIPLATLGAINVATAVLVHETAELLAVANGLRAGTVKSPVGNAGAG